MMRNFDTRVGRDDAEWSGVIGRFREATMNGSGREVPELL